MSFTVVFEGDVAAFDDNPMDFESDFGKVSAIGKGDALGEVERLLGVIAEASTKLKLLYIAAGLGQKTGRAALDALNAEITKLDAVTYGNQQSTQEK